LRTREAPLARRIEESLTQFESSVGSLPGISQSAQRDVFVEQLVESDRRRRYVQRLVESKLSPSRTDPRSENFDPLRAAIVFQREGKVEEAFWMLFLFVHFGKHRVAGWRYAARVYGKLEDTTRWDWRNVCLDVSGFREWLDQNSEMIKAGSDRRGFGNHRKYESLSGSSMSGTGAVVASYVEWVGPTQSHVKRVRILLSDVGDNPSVAFDYLYQSMNSVQRFGRTARFDYLSMAGKIGLIDIVCVFRRSCTVVPT